MLSAGAVVQRYHTIPCGATPGTLAPPRICDSRNTTIARIDRRRGGGRNTTFRVILRQRTRWCTDTNTGATPGTLTPPKICGSRIATTAPNRPMTMRRQEHYIPRNLYFSVRAGIPIQIRVRTYDSLQRFYVQRVECTTEPRLGGGGPLNSVSGLIQGSGGGGGG